MKIIGKTSGGFILEASEKEVLQIVGSDRLYCGDQGQRELGICVDAEIKIDPLYEALTFEKGRVKRLESLENSIRETADLVGKAAKNLKAPRGTIPESKES